VAEKVWRLVDQKEWDQHWMHEYNRYWNDPKTRTKAFEYANEVMARKYGERPDAPPSFQWLAFRAFWLIKVKGMDWKKVGLGAFAAALGAVAAAIPAAAEGGITGNEWWGILAVALGAVALFLKNPDAKGFAHPSKKNGH
jgi:hypothetical protein